MYRENVVLLYWICSHLHILNRLLEKGAIFFMNKDKYDIIHFLVIICLTLLHMHFGYNDWILGFFIVIYTIFGVLLLEGFSRYSVVKCLILMPLFLLLMKFITLYS